MSKLAAKYSYFFIVLTSFLLVMLELFTYSGFVEKHIFLPVNFYLLFSYTLLLMLLLKLKQQSFKKLAVFLFVFAIFATLIMIFLAAIELRSYPNYIFSKFHIELKVFPLVIGYLLSLTFIPIFSRRTLKMFRKKKSIYLCVSLLLTVYIFNNSISVAGTIRRLLPSAVYKWDLSYSDKMFYLWGDPYRFLEITNKITPDNATIFIPPRESAHAITGNVGFDKYFLYPRNIFSFKEGEKHAGYLVSSPGDELGGGDFLRWPNSVISSDYYFIINAKENTVEKITGDYKPKELGNDEWSLIKI